MKSTFDHNGETTPIDLTPSGKSYRAAIEDQILNIEILRAEDGELDLLVDGKRITAYVSSDGPKRWVTINGQTIMLTTSSSAGRRGHGGHHAAGELTAPMPGQVRAVNVSEGEAVTKGQTLLVLEAMKMEIRIHAPQDGTVKRLFVRAGETVEREQMLIEVDEG